MTRSLQGPVDFNVLRLKRALARFGLNVAEASPETVRDLYQRLIVDDASEPEHSDTKAPG